MWKRVFSLGLVASVVALAAACDGGDDNSYGSYAGGGAYCRQYTTCGTCTPVAGCGWCQTGVGQGMCADEPNDCATNPAFSWTWNPSGCFGTPADASVVTPPPDAAPPPVSTPDGSAPLDAGTASDGAILH